MSEFWTQIKIRQMCNELGQLLCPRDSEVKLTMNTSVKHTKLLDSIIPRSLYSGQKTKRIKVNRRVLG